MLLIGAGYQTGYLQRLCILKFETPPTLSKTHTFTVTMTANDGRVFSDSVRMTFE